MRIHIHVYIYLLCILHEFALYQREHMYLSFGGLIHFTKHNGFQSGPFCEEQGFQVKSFALKFCLWHELVG